MKEAEAIPIIPAVRLFVRRRQFGIIVTLGQMTRNYEEAAVKITQVELYEVEIPPIPVIARYFPKIYDSTLCRVQNGRGLCNQEFYRS